MLMHPKEKKLSTSYIQEYVYKLIPNFEPIFLETRFFNTDHETTRIVFIVFASIFCGDFKTTFSNAGRIYLFISVCCYITSLFLGQ